MKNIRIFYRKMFQFLEVKFLVYLNRHVFVMWTHMSEGTFSDVVAHVNRPNWQVTLTFR